MGDVIVYRLAMLIISGAFLVLTLVDENSAAESGAFWGVLARHSYLGWRR